MVLLWPMLTCGFNGDDLLNCFMPGILAERDTNAVAFACRQIGKWLHEFGRFYPLAFYYVPFFACVRSLIVYRVLGLLVIGLNLYLFARLVERLTGSGRTG